MASDRNNDSSSQEILAAIQNNGKEKAKKKVFGNVTVERTDGEKIILPDGMSLPEARAWLEKIEKAEEQVINFRSEIKCYPYDGAYALYRAMQEKFGYADVITAKNPSGGTPPTMVSLRLPDNTMINVPWGRLSFPGLDANSYLETSYNNAEMKFVIAGTIKRKFQKAVDHLIILTEQILKESSIYKGNAIRVNLEFMDKGTTPTQPEFLNQAVSSIQDADVLMNETTRLNYAAVLLRIKKSEHCVKNNIQLKHGALLAGPYGTGKTLLAKYTAKIAIENGWTFLYLDDARQLKNALRLAEMYAPCVVFTEDIDKAVEGSNRTNDINAILNTLDGIDTKSNPIITVLTTNHIENINKAFLRAGRIDSLITMTPLDSVTGAQFLDRFARDKKGNSVLDSEHDFTEAGAALTGIVPAFASEVVNKAKMYAMYNDRELLVPTDIMAAADSYKEHIRLTTENAQPTAKEIVADAVHTINTYGTNLSDADLKEIKSDVRKIKTEYCGIE